MKKSIYFLAGLLLFSCQPSNTPEITTKETSDYLDYTGSKGEFSGGVQLIPIETEAGTFNVWTKRVGNNPDMKLLLLHGGPGATHEYFECFDSFLPKAGIEYYYYDQLESAYSDQPNDPSLWSVERYVDEVEQVRKALGLTKDNFYVLGSSWGGILAMEYALKYPDNLKGLIVSNMMASVPEYNTYAMEVLGPQMDSTVLAEVMAMEAAEDYANPRYAELLFANYYTEHVLRLPLAEWPDPVNRAFANINQGLYVTMQGPSEFGIKGDAKLLEWDITDQLPNIAVPTLSIGGAYDTMDPKHMEMIANTVQNGQYLHCPNGSHLAMYDDQQTYFEGLIRFMREVNGE